MKRWTRKLLAGLLSFGMLLQMASPLSALAEDGSSAAPELTITLQRKNDATPYVGKIDQNTTEITLDGQSYQVDYQDGTYILTGTMGTVYESSIGDHLTISGPSDGVKPNLVMRQGENYQVANAYVNVENVNDFTSDSIAGITEFTCDGDIKITADYYAVDFSFEVKSAHDVTVISEKTTGQFVVGSANITCTGKVTLRNEGEGALTHGSGIRINGAQDGVELYCKNATRMANGITIENCKGDISIINENGPIGDPSFENDLTVGGKRDTDVENVTIKANAFGPVTNGKISVTSETLTMQNDGGSIGNLTFTRTDTTGDYYIATGDSASSAASQTKIEGNVYDPGMVSAKYLRISTDGFVPAPATPYGFSVNGTSVTAENAGTTLPDGMTYDIATNKLTATKDITGDLTIEVTDTALKLDVSLQSVTGDVTLLGVNDVAITGTVNGMLTVGTEDAYASGNVTVNGRLLGGTEINCIGDVKATGSSDGGILKTKDFYQPDIIRCNGAVYLENAGNGYTTCSLTVIGATDVTVKANGGFHAAISGEGDITCSGTVTLTTTGVRAMGSNDPLTYTQMQGDSYTVQLDDQTPFTRTGIFKESEVNLLKKVKSIIITPAGSTPAPGPDDGDTTPDDTGTVDSGSDAGGAVAAVLVGGVAVWGGYEIATRVILHNILPEGAAIPANRGQLALLVWNNAGRPEPAAQPAFADVADADMAKAAQWCVEQGIMEAKTTETFKPEGWTPKLKVIEVWNKAFPKQ